MNKIWCWNAVGGPLGRLRLAATEAGLCKLALGRESDDAFLAWLARVMQPDELCQWRHRHIEHALSEIKAYLSGKLRVFETSLDVRGTPFQRQVWAAVANVPFSETVTYGEIARRLGRPRTARAVGAANAANPLPLFVPCHRVVGADGALRGYGGGVEVKALLLRLESK
jgi:O-6-methylguanine DNA methyltransferase